jgi:hypothetical protein
MGTVFPASYDAFSNPAAADQLASPPHHTQHGDANDAIEAIERRVGTSGTSFPGSPTTGDLFWRTDRLLEYVWTGAEWVTTNQYTFEFKAFDNISVTTEIGWPPAHETYGMYIERFDQSFYVGGGTALGASHKWDMLLKSFVGNTGTNRLAATIDSGLSDNWRNLGSGGTIAVIGADMFTITVTKTGTPGNLNGVVRVTYRLIG